MHNIVIVGGGSSAHTVIPLLASHGHNVSVLTSKPQYWNLQVESKYINENGELVKTFSGDVSEVSDSYEKLIPKAEIVLLCMPVNQYPTAIEKIVNASKKNQKLFLGTVYGQAGFNWIVDYYTKESARENIVPFAIGLIPWVCRIEKYGTTGITYGAKVNNVIAIHDKDDFEYLNERFLPDLCYSSFGIGEFKRADNFISLTLSVDNQIIHTSRLYGLSVKSGGEWDKEEDVPMFYRDYDLISANLLADLDSDYEKLREKVRAQSELDFSYMLNYLDLEHFSYGSCSSDILDSFKNSSTLGAIKTPVVFESGKFVFDKKNRFFYDDIYFGLCIAKWIASQLHVKTETIDKILHWAQGVLGEKIIDKEGHLHDELVMNGLPTRWNRNSIIDILD